MHFHTINLKHANIPQLAYLTAVEQFELLRTLEEICD
jgi:hypothetical protein